LKDDIKTYTRKIGKTIYIVSIHYSGDKNIIQKLGELILRDFNNERDK